jgi:hypothetical protein
MKRYGLVSKYNNIKIVYNRKYENKRDDSYYKNYINSKLISGEKIQDIADIFLGIPQDFTNPFFQKSKKIQDITNIGKNEEDYDNPYKIFCFTHRINILSQKIKYFKNPFVLITHNSDDDIIDTPDIKNILNNDKLVRWFSQNLCIEHYKLYFLPIGIANLEWKHGKDFYNFYNENNKNKDNNDIYMCFNINTNIKKRKLCYDILSKKIQFLPQIDSIKNLERLNQYKYCICPDGNGIDTHRFWESLYLKIIPIVLRNPLNTILEKYTDIPMIILESWDDFNINNIKDNKIYNFDSKYLDMNFYKNSIEEIFNPNIDHHQY